MSAQSESVALRIAAKMFTRLDAWDLLLSRWGVHNRAFGGLAASAGLNFGPPAPVRFGEPRGGAARESGNENCCELRGD